ncbi:MAG: ATP-dependent DNA ligase [Cytophagaceae bacterium]
MKLFAELFNKLDKTSSTKKKVQALVDYFSSAEKTDALWAIAMLTGKRPKRPVNTNYLRMWASEVAGLPLWLFEESYHVTGDLAEAINLMLPKPSMDYEGTLTDVMSLLKNISAEDEATKRSAVLDMWQKLGGMERYLFNKLIAGSFRVGVSQKLVINALSKYTDKPASQIAHRLSGNWEPDLTKWEELIESENITEVESKPYPFYLAYQLDMNPSDLGDINDWLIERKYDGIRGQIIIRNKNMYIWSRGEGLLSVKFPEFNKLPQFIPDGTVIDGEILPYKDGKPLLFNFLQTRIGRKNISKKNLEEAPVVMIAYDLLEFEGKDIRNLPLSERRKMLKDILTEENKAIILSPELNCNTWEDAAIQREEARALGCEGLMLKLKSAEYETGRKKGKWWKWKVDPMTVDAVLIYAQRGSGRRATLYTDYTFAIWKNGELVPFAKAYSGLSDKEILEIDSWIKRNTIEKFGPVRRLKPHFVFELAFEAINPSSRHKSGVAVRFPRIYRIRHDKSIDQANSYEDLMNLYQSLYSFEKAEAKSI